MSLTFQSKSTKINRKIMAEMERDIWIDGFIKWKIRVHFVSAGSSALADYYSFF